MHKVPTLLLSFNFNQYEYELFIAQISHRYTEIYVYNW